MQWLLPKPLIMVTSTESSNRAMVSGICTDLLRSSIARTENIENFFGINNESGHLPTDRKEVLRRWRDYFEEISTMEFPQSEHLKSKICRVVVRPVAMYGAECWSAIKGVEMRLSVMETKMLRCTGGALPCVT
ncbi:unnamed protein product [Heligmosomoides polygyrus]|uniref:Uncharacterized protein n=1 Tax=Heligmosomoides polygyrus TaxID=6339 RepID=A0A183F2U9_HELPZ|nr:unnamed protein product [Heligmosomoides polygyrus]